MRIDNDDAVDHLFTYHAPFGTQTDRYEEIRRHARLFARQIMAQCPASEERTLALRDLQRCVMMANASIALNEKSI